MPIKPKLRGKKNPQKFCLVCAQNHKLLPASLEASSKPGHKTSSKFNHLSPSLNYCNNTWRSQDFLLVWGLGACRDTTSSCLRLFWWWKWGWEVSPLGIQQHKAPNPSQTISGIIPEHSYEHISKWTRPQEAGGQGWVGGRWFLADELWFPCSLPSTRQALQEPPTTPWSQDLKRCLLHQADGEEMIKPHSLPLTAACRGFYLMPEVAAEPLEMHLLKWNPQWGWEERGNSLKLLLKKQSFVETDWKTWGRQGRVWKHVHETLAARTPPSAAHPEALAEITEIKFCAAGPQPTEFTPWFWFHGSFPPCWKHPSVKATQVSVWLCTPGKAKPTPHYSKVGREGWNQDSTFRAQEDHISSPPHTPLTTLPPLPSSPFLILFQVWQPVCFFFSSIETDITASLSQAPAPQTQPGPGQTQEKHRDMERNVQDTLRLPSTSDPSRYCSELLRKKAQSICPLSSVQEGNTILCPLLHSNSSSTHQIMTLWNSTHQR